MGEIKTENIDKEALLDKDNNQDESKHSSASSQIKKGDEQNLNIRAAIIHLLGDIV